MKRTFSIILIIFGIALTSSITTVHHDKPESVALSTNQGTTTESPISSTALIVTNVTLTASERKKRLLPYQNFYFNQPFNRPHQVGVSSQQHKDYEDTGPVNKKPEYEPVSSRPKDILYQPSQKYTPFLDSNALPGHFRPMVSSNGNNAQKTQYTYLNLPPVQEERYIPLKEHSHPDFGVIYDQLSQLKLRQQELHNKPPYGYRLVPNHRFRERPQQVQEYRPTIFDAATRYKINPSKTTIETFTATNIDIPDPTEEEKYELQPPRYHQIPTPTKEHFSGPVQTSYREKPFIRHQIAIEVPQSSLIRKPSNSKERPRKPYIIIQQGKPDAKQPVLILRKPKPAVVVNENYVAEKYISHVPSKPHHYQPRPIYNPQEPQYSPAPVYEDNYEPQYQVTAVPAEYRQQEPQSFVTPLSYEVEYGAKLTPEQPQKVEFKPIVAAPSTPQYEDEHNEYYRYQAVTPGPPPSITSGPVNGPIRINQKLIPQYQEVPKIQEEIYRTTSQNPKVQNSGGNSNSLSEILKQLQESNTLPQTLTPDNIDNSIKTLVRILNALRDRQKQSKPAVTEDPYDYENEAGVDLGVDLFDTPDGGTPGKPGVDYPALSTIPKTNFNCKTQRYKGFFGDPDTNCQVWHYCDLNGGQASFLCPNGTIFSQVALTCDWWYNVKCSSTAQLYVLNERLYKYIIPLSPKFPEDYSGPLVDKYLAMKFQEMEEKLRKQKKGKANKDPEDSEEDSENSDDEETDDENDSSKEESETVEEIEMPTTEEIAEVTAV